MVVLHAVFHTHPVCLCRVRGVGCLEKQPFTTQGTKTVDCNLLFSHRLRLCRHVGPLFNLLFCTGGHEHMGTYILTHESSVFSSVLESTLALTTILFTFAGRLVWRTMASFTNLNVGCRVRYKTGCFIGSMAVVDLQI
jgi:hypothetical protein